ncbi:hypothetical protein ASG67_06770 [Sphingomonas sp. Leaf339]|uniref:PEPxxWA-CTERM sorting domain-containing protein n=1 Tax=Sphingomonas sp. Leaf339 TaxID=1736343 RepID=UPI0006FC3626|nr:PEPxxWA-CTERM sorting domain-containing protein [Sphingomonas sp. Leaf339]KQU55811.1 hypothetical protein ASG67_06770 [Sphingomonas sp. Leaf339]
MNRLALIAALATATVAAPSAEAATTMVTAGTRGLQILEYGPAGQSFTTTESQLLSFGFQFQTANASMANDPVTLTLLAGSGLNGVTVATRTVTLPTSAARTSFWYDFDLAGTTLIANTSYTALLSTTSIRLAVMYGPSLMPTPNGADAYSGGSLVATKPQIGYCLTDPCDANFRFTTVAGAVPEPATWAMMLVGFAMVGGTVRYRRRNVRLAYR